MKLIIEGKKKFIIGLALELSERVIKEFGIQNIAMVGMPDGIRITVTEDEETKLL